MANLANIAALAELDGALCVDKPVGLSAHDAMKAVKTHFNLVKIGHGGTLEATATGLFVLFLGKSTHLSEDLAARDRTYSGTFRLGRDTDTGDRAGNVRAERDASAVTRETLEKALADFRGDIYQAPPEFSAVKIPNREGYQVVRTAEGDELREKLVHVYRFSVTAFEAPDVSFSLKATRGVSVRALVRDLGRALGCGATLTEWRRERQGAFDLAQAVPFMKIMQTHPADFPSLVIPPVAFPRP